MSDAAVEIIGSYLSPYVRKVLVCLAIKGIPYRIDPIVPFYGNDEFTRVSPLRRVPVLIDGSTHLADSTVICEYLEERFPNPPLFPASPADRGRARWLEEFADSRMGEVFVWHLFNEVVIRRFVWGEATDSAVVEKAREIEIPQILDYLEGEAPADVDYFFGTLGLADIAVASFFRNARFAGFLPDAARWPRIVGLVARVLDQPAFAELRSFEDISLRTPIPRQREALAEAGAPLTLRSFGTPAPRPAFAAEPD